MKKLLIIILLAVASMHVQAGMRFTAIMVTQEQFEQYKSDEDAIFKELLEPNPDTVLDLDKAWHGLHYILTGTAWSPKGVLGQAILGGKEFGSNLGYGPARFLTTDQVANISIALNNITKEQIKKRYDPNSMMKLQIYPTVWAREADEGLNWLIQGFEQMKEFYSTAAKNKKRVILVIL